MRRPVEFDFATLLLLFVHASFRHRCWAAHQYGILSATSRAEMADVEQMKNIIPFVTCEITTGQNVCELMFGINVSNLNFRIKIHPVTPPIHSNLTLWVLETCHIVGLRPLVIILITDSLSSKTYNTALEPECVPFDGT